MKSNGLGVVGMSVGFSINREEEKKDNDLFAGFTCTAVNNASNMNRAQAAAVERAQNFRRRERERSRQESASRDENLPRVNSNINNISREET